MFNLKIFVVFVLLMFLMCSCQKKNSSDLYNAEHLQINPTESIESIGNFESEAVQGHIGYWQVDAGVIGSGFAERYSFNENGTFWWANNQMVFSHELVASKGTWSYSNGKMILTVTDEYRIIGGEVIDSNLSADGKELKGGVLKHFIVSGSAVGFDATIPSKSDEDGIMHTTFMLDGHKLYNYDNQTDFFEDWIDIFK